MRTETAAFLVATDRGVEVAGDMTIAATTISEGVVDMGKAMVMAVGDMVVAMNITLIIVASNGLLSLLVR